MTRVILIRHCEAEGNVKRIFQGHTDAEVSENGLRQLDLLSLRLRNTKIDVLYSSPLKRAYITAQAVNRYHNLPILQEKDLMELDGGEWEGIPWAELPEKYPEMASVWWNTPHDFASEKGESMRQLYDRIWNAVIRLVKEHPGKTIAVTSHGCAIRNFLCRANGWPIERLNDIDWCDNTAVTIVDFDEELNADIQLVNDASHLTEEVSTFSKQDWWRPENKDKEHFE
ncbi:histidine phosphatase family protein [Clostridium minihomine]|uniref:histidine phosphatase family protein n=1 Tax=Clostridium minihomine TaxID=2045012 RepID=UPI000C76BB86|nr:histidine phosphatase family protein [Clostridium minihomine]